MKNWSDLFNPVQDCECQDCMSIFSPAAYLIDIMQFLDHCPNAGQSPLQVLLKRRPDIGKLLLTCENTNTEIPYIDLVNEVMEYYVAYQKNNSLVFTPGNTGNATAEELRADPQYVITDAYKELYRHFYPFNMPYHQPLDVMRTYLEFLNTSRAELMEVFQKYITKDNSNPPNITVIQIPAAATDAENLQLSLCEYEILTNANFLGSTISLNANVEDYFGDTVPSYTGKGIAVTDLLQRTGLQYTELIAILETKFINPGQMVLNVLQNLINTASAIDAQNIYDELAGRNGNDWNTDTSDTFTKLLQPNNISKQVFSDWLNANMNNATNFQKFQQVITINQASANCTIENMLLLSVQRLYEVGANAGFTQAIPTIIDNVQHGFTDAGDDFNINTTFLSKFHRFIRLWKKTGWAIHELDNITSTLNETDITPLLIHKLATLKKINAILNLPLPQLSVLWGDIDTYGNGLYNTGGIRSLYAQLFLKNTGNTTSQQSIFTPDPLNEISSAQPALLDDHLPEIFAALSISADDFSIIMEDAKPADRNISLSNLSLIYRYKLLARALSLSLADLCILKTNLFKVDPFNSIDNTFDFIQQVQQFKNSGFTVPVLNYILTGEYKDIDNIALQQDKIFQMLIALRTSLLQIDAAYNSSNQNQAKPADLKLAKQKQELAKQKQVISSLSQLIDLDNQSTGSLINSDLDQFITNASQTGLTAYYFNKPPLVTGPVIKTDAEINLQTADKLPVTSSAFNVRWEGWLCPATNGDYLFTINTADVNDHVNFSLDGIKTKMNVPCALSGGKMYALTVEYTHNSGNAGIALLWQSANMPLAVIDTLYLFPKPEVKHLAEKIVLYYRAAQFIKGFSLSAAEVIYFINNKADFEKINFVSITIKQWLRIIGYITLSKTIQPDLLIPIFQLASHEDKVNPGVQPSVNLISAIANAAKPGWNKDDLSYLVSYFNYTAKDFKNEIALLQVKKAMDLAIKTKIPVNNAGLPVWTAIETDLSKEDDFDELNNIAGQIKNAVKAKYKDNWLTIAAQLNDPVRENQKHALTSYLLTLQLPLPDGTGKVEDANALFEYLLIDVQMSTIVLTSRLIQATMAVQLFADRCLLGMEKEVDVKAINTNEWNWMKHYSIAAGLKKIFVYPENYLDPSLRDDKSPFFKELESELKKTDITDENVENAFRNYLYKLNEVSNLELCGMYNDKDTQTMYVFGRTKQAPYQYYFRNAFAGTLENSWKWTAWEKVELDIKSVEDTDNRESSGVHLMPVVWKKRLFLFWPEFMQKTVSTGSSTNSPTFQQISNTSPDDNKPQKYWEIRFAWSEYINENWSPKKISKETFSPFLDTWKLYYQRQHLPNIIYNHNTLDEIADLTQKNASSDEIDKKTKSLKAIYSIPEIPCHCFSFKISINANNQLLEITANIGAEYMNKIVLTINPAPLFTISLTDITSQFLTNTVNADIYEGALIEGIHAGNSEMPVIDSGNYTSDQPFFQQYRINKGDSNSPDQGLLTLAAKNILQTATDHQVLFSNNLVIDTFEESIQYPFFFTDLDSDNIYFATPTQISVTNNVINRLHLGYSVPLSFLSNDAKAIGYLNASDDTLPDTIINAPLNNTTNNIGQPIAGKSKNHFNSFSKDGNSFSKAVTSAVRPVNYGLAFYTFYHPLTSTFIKKFNEGGVPMLMAADTAEFPQDHTYPNIDDSPATVANDQGNTFAGYDPNFDYVQEYDPSDTARNYYLENVDFSEYGTYSIYNWELFFHAPFLIATRLSKNGKYAEARKWFHYIFDPLSSETPDAPQSSSPFWGVLPFKKESGNNITSFLENLKAGYNNNSQVDDWRNDPFNVFLAARNRPIAFMKNVVMSYLDNLIAWGDDLFRTYTRENINEATQLYIIAAHILGPKPQYITLSGVIQPSSYNDLLTGLDDFGDAIVAFENTFPTSGAIQEINSPAPQTLIGIGQALYFCIPPNDKLLQYWTTVGERLFKIRHGQNINGIAIPLALYEPPVDPELLLQAKASGLDITGIVAEMESPVPIYRFNYLLQKAKEFCSEVISFGNALLSASEKQDTEQLSRLRQTQEMTLLNMVTEVKTRQVLEAKANLDNLNSGRTTAIQRLQHYTMEMLGNPASVVPSIAPPSDTLDENSNLPGETIIATVTSTINVSLVGTDESGVKIIPNENEEINNLNNAYYLQQSISSAHALESILHLIPDENLNAMPFGVGTALTLISGDKFAESVAAASEVLQIFSNGFTHASMQASKIASFIRREQDWVFQANMAAREIVQIDRQIVAAQIRLQMAQHELDNHRKQIENANEIEQFLETKFSRQELYQWMIDKIQDAHKQGYQLAYDMARKAEKAYRFELGLPESNFIQYGYYENTYIGITAGEQLQSGLKQMDASYIDNNLREFEIVKHISLALVDPYALLQLKQTGVCQPSLPEELFDLDFPGHYFRRIKSVSLSIPCIVGPYTSVNCTMRLIENSIRIDKSTGNQYERNNENGIMVDDNRFSKNNIPFNAIATSSAQNDSGVFELNFSDERYLPFEGAGVISKWQIELNGKYSNDNDNNIVDYSQFDFDTISDVILHIKYTSREDSGQFRQAAIAHLDEYISNAINNATAPFMRLFALKQEFPNEWHQFQNANITALNLQIDKFRFPFLAQQRKPTIQRIMWFVDKLPSDSNVIINAKSYSLAMPVMLGNYYQYILDVPGEVIDTSPMTITLSPAKDTTDTLLLFVYKL